MKKINNLLALLFAAVLLFSSCAGGTTATLTTTAASTGGGTTTSKTTAVTTKPSPWEIDEDVNFRGETFTFAILTDYGDIDGYGIGESESGDKYMNVTIKERNEYIYETFNGKTEIVKMSAAALASELEAGSCKVDFVYAPYGAVNTKYCYDTESLEVDFTQPWWNSVTSRMRAGGKSYAMAGCFSLETYDSLEAMFFNKDVQKKVASLKDVDFYELVYENEWTIDKLLEFSRLALAEAEMCGFISEKDGVSSLYFASGQRFISETQNGGETVFVNGFNEAARAVTDKIIAVFGDDSVKTGERAEVLDALTSGKTLFAKATIGDMKKFYEEKLYCGIMPLPGGEKSAEASNCVSADVPFLFALKSGASPEYTKYYLWYLARFSYTTIYRDFLNLYKYQYTADTDSAVMVDYIISSVAFDAARSYGWEGAEEKYISAVLAGENPVEKFRTELYPELEAKAKE